MKAQYSQCILTVTMRIEKSRFQLPALLLFGEFDDWKGLILAFNIVKRAFLTYKSPWRNRLIALLTIWSSITGSTPVVNYVEHLQIFTKTGRFILEALLISREIIFQFLFVMLP